MNMPILDSPARHLGALKPLIAGSAVLAALLFMIVTPPPALATSFVVDTSADTSLTACTGAAGDCSLRGAITNANANGGADTITFDPSGFTNSITSPDTVGDVGQFSSMVLDASGFPVMAYYDNTNQDLKVAHCGDVRCNGVQITSPDTTGNVGAYASIALDASGFPVVAYYDDTNDDLKVLHCGDAICSAGNSIAIPDTTGDVGGFLSLTLDGSGRAVVSYFDATNGALKVLHCGNANCTAGNSITTADTTGTPGWYTSIALDASGFPVVSYYTTSTADLTVLHCGNANCTAGNNITSPDTAGSTGRHTSLELDANGFPVVSYYDVSNDNLKILHCGNANCTSGNSITTPDGAAGDVGWQNSLELDALGFPVVSYHDSTGGDLRVLHCGNVNCTSGNSIATPDTANDTGWFTSLALDSSGSPVVSYYDFTNGNLKVLHCANGNCTNPNSITSPDTTGQVGQYTSMALDASGFPVIAYYDLNGFDLKIIHCGDANCSAGNTFANPDGTGNVGQMPSIKLDGSGFPVVSYYDNTNQDLKVLHCNDVNCAAGGDSVVSPDTGGIVGQYSSLALDASGFPVVSYSDSTNNDLKVLHCGNANCTAGNTITNPDGAGIVGDYTSLKLDASGFPVVSYRDTTNLGLKLLHCGNANCTAGNVVTLADSGGSVGTDTSLALDASGFPVISYRDVTNSDLKIVHCSNANCTAGPVTKPDTQGLVGTYTSLALDTSGFPVVSYSDDTNQDLKVLHCGNANCTAGNSVTSPDTGGSVGQFSSLALDILGAPVVSHWDQTNADLRVLHCGDRNCGPGTIGLASALPALTNTGDTIDGAGAITVLGGGIAAFDCLTISGPGADSNTIKGLRIANCNDGIEVSNGADTNVIGGTTVTDRNVISGNNNGVHIEGSSAANNSVVGNFIGTDAAGVTGLANQTGLYIESTATGTIVGGTTSAHRNVISANAQGIYSFGTGDVISANYFGLTENGNSALVNLAVNITFNGTSQTLGGSTAGHRNVISGGVFLANSTGAVVKGNYIGTNAAGTAAVAGGGVGLQVYGTSDTSTIGGTAAADRNVISGNATDGVVIDQGGTISNTVLGNYIGVAADGATALPNGQSGVKISGGATGNTIGGATAGARNVISGNSAADGVNISGSGTSGNFVRGNYVGTNAAGTAAVPNFNGIVIGSGATSNSVGGSSAGEGNLVSGNTTYGVVVTGSAATGNTVSGNYIGTNSAGTADLGNGADGVRISAAATGNTVGGSSAGARNLISGNNSDGIEVNGASSTGTVIKGNYIGTNAAGTGAIANSANGITTDAASFTIGGTVGVTPGGSCTGECNLVSGNTSVGISVFAGGAGIVVKGNNVGTDVTGGLDLGNGSAGIRVQSTNSVTIGGSAAGEGNIASGNGTEGVDLMSADSIVVRGNYIGTNAAGASIGNSQNGVEVDSLSNNETIGGTAAGEANRIAFNVQDGVVVRDGPANSIRGNSIHSNGGLGIDLDPNGVTANDAGDGDTGANNLMNFPVISSVTYNGGTRAFTVSGTLDTASPDTASVDVYATDPPDGSGNGEGRQYLGSATPSIGGAWTFNGTGVPLYGRITATATKASDGTSEFSLAFDADVDGDGFPSSTDNCDVNFNPFQIDHDADAVGDACDSAVRNRFTAAASSLQTEYTTAVGDQLLQDNRVIAPWDFQAGSTVNIGAQAGEVDLAFSVKSATACDSGVSVPDMALLNASTDNSPGNLVNTASIVADGDGDTIVDGVEGYPRFLNTMYDPEARTGVDEDSDGLVDEDGPNGVDNDGDTRVDEDGSGSPVAPHARYLGQYGGGGFIQILVFEEDPDDRYRMELVWNDPTGASGVSCAPFEISQTIFTTSVTNTVANPDVTGGQAVLVNPGTGTRVVRAQGIDRPDADGDLQDNHVDNCKLVANATQVDGDADGIGDVCDPTPAVNTGSFDHDGDGYANVSDNCPTVSNASQAEAEVRTPRTFGVPFVDDFIGDACDPNPLRTDDVHYTINGPSTRELRGVHINEYSDPICITGGGVVDADGDGWCAANDPDDGAAATGPENESLVLPATGTFARGLCNNGVSDDGDPDKDFADSDCVDQDGDFVPDNVDVCDQASDPLQLDLDADGIGDACEANSIIKLSAVSTSNAANSELRWRFVETAPDALHKQDGILQLIDSEFDGTSDWGVVGGASVANGAIRATLTDFVTVGIDPDPLVPLIGGRPCVNVLPLNFTLLDASTDPNDAIDNGATLTALGADGDADGLVNGVEQYPAFLKSLPIGHAKIDNDSDLLVDEDPVDSVNNDGDGLTDEDPTEAAAPLVRMFGYTVFQGAPRVLNILVYGVGALPALPNTDGYPVVMVYDNPFAYTPRYNVQATCSHQDHRMSTFGVSVDFPGTVANEGGIKLMNNDSAATTERFFTRVTSYPDLDGDVIENPLDACPFDADNDEDGTPDQSDATPWNPRLVLSPGDPDSDGLPNKCDPNDFVPSPPGSPSDEDSDGIGNNADNCRTVSNSNQQDSDTDGLGNACDPNTMLPSGAVQRVIYGHPICTNGTNVDGDGYCTDVDPNDGDDNRVPEIGVFDPSVCSNSVNDDFPEDSLIDLADPGCGDIDGDQVLNEMDNCKDTKNGPAQANVPGFGNQVDTDNDVGGEHLGQQPFARTDLGDPFVVGEPFARTEHRWGGDACDVDDDNDGLPDGNECDEVDDGDAYVNDGCTALGLFSEGDQPAAACSNATDEADEDLIAPGLQNDDTVPNDGCPQQGAQNEDKCRTDPDCDDDLLTDLFEWTNSCDLPSGGVPDDLDIDTAVSPNARSNNLDGDVLFTYGEQEAGTNPCVNNNADVTFGSDNDLGSAVTGDDYLGAFEKYMGTLPTDNCQAGQPSAAWPADMSNGFQSVNKLTILDLSQYIAPVRRINTSPGNAAWNRRFDLIPGPGAISEWVNILDLTNLLQVTPAMAPYNNNKAFNHAGACTP